MSGIELIAAERARQTKEEGWSVEHDDEHRGGGLAAAAAAYAMNAFEQLCPYLQGADHNAQPAIWPWGGAWWKPKDPLRDLVRAGALIAAEIDRLERSAAVPAKSTLTKTTINPAEPWPFPPFKP